VLKTKPTTPPKPTEPPSTPPAKPQASKADEVAKKLKKKPTQQEARRALIQKAKQPANQADHRNPSVRTCIDDLFLFIVIGDTEESDLRKPAPAKEKTSIPLLFRHLSR
jgi:hypothetical protein